MYTVPFLDSSHLLIIKNLITNVFKETKFDIGIHITFSMLCMVIDQVDTNTQRGHHSL